MQRYRRAFLYVPALVAGAAAVAFLINRRSFWLDEADSWYFSSQRFSDMFRAMRYEDSVLLFYYSLLHLWQILGHSAVVLRSLSALCALAAIPIVAAIAMRMFGARHAVIASLLLALNAAYLYYATEARPYGAVLLFAALSMYLFLRAAVDGERRALSWYAAAVCAMVYLHAFAMLLPVAQIVSLAIIRVQRRTAIAFAWCYAAIVVALVPLFLLAARNGVQQIAWIPGLSRATFAQFAENLTGTLPLAFVLAALVIIGVWKSWRDSRPATVLLVWAFVPIALGALISLHQHIFIARYFMYTLIPVCILAAHGLLSLRPALVRIVAAAAVLAVTGHGLWYLSGYQVEDWRSALGYVAAHASPHDGRVVYAPYEVVPYQYALLESHTQTDPALLYPAGSKLAAFDRTTPLPATALHAFATGRVWIIVARTPDIAKTPLQAAFSYARLVSERRFQGISVYLFTPGS